MCWTSTRFECILLTSIRGRACHSTHGHHDSSIACQLDHSLPLITGFPLVGAGSSLFHFPPHLCPSFHQPPCNQGATCLDLSGLATLGLCMVTTPSNVESRPGYLVHC